MPKPKPFKTEADLCAAFLSVLPKEWTAYNETEGWDILLVRNTDGFQIGIEAKLRLNPLVLSQALEENRYCVTSDGPDCRAVLVPRGEATRGMHALCDYIGVVIIRVEPGRIPNGTPREVHPRLPNGETWRDQNWHEWAPSKRCEIPEYVPDVTAGKRSPLQLTAWKIGAIKIAVLIEQRGFVTRQDFRTAGIDVRRWVARETGWLVARGLQLVPGPRIPDFKAQHPVNYEQIKADMARWAKPEKEPQGVLV